MSPLCMPETRPILGHDRNGREVRMGDRIRYVGHEHTSPVVAVDRSYFETESGYVTLDKAELVTDEKAERCPGKVGSKPCDLLPGHGGPHMLAMTKQEEARLLGRIEDPGKPTRINYDCDWPGSGTVPSEALRAVESFTRWLAAPTTVERFEAFKARMTMLLEGYSALKVEFDCRAAGLLCVVRHPVFAEMYPDDERRNGYCFDEISSDHAVIASVRCWAEWLGRKALRT
jgi:hypothetical protein